MRSDPRVDLADLLEAAENVRTFMVGRNRDDYDDDLFLRSAVDRQFEIVGEALNRLRHDDAVVAGRVPDVVKIIGFRNIRIHGYDIVDRDAVWAAITVEVPASSSVSPNCWPSSTRRPATRPPFHSHQSGRRRTTTPAARATDPTATSRSRATSAPSMIGSADPGTARHQPKVIDGS